MPPFAAKPAAAPSRPEAVLRASRRGFLKSVLAGGAATAALTLPNVEALAQGRTARFLHSVASGDPLQNRVIIWTRATPDASGDLFIAWLVATNPEMTNVVRYGLAYARAEADYCVKVDVDGLQPGVTYYYQFIAGGVRSPLGRTQTLPTGGVSRWAFAFVSCANYDKGFFNVYREVANRGDINAVLYLGDYIYEYAQAQITATGTVGYVTPAMSLAAQSGLPITTFEPRRAALQPLTETIRLNDYRTRYALYRSDVNLQEAHRLHPAIMVWDDHESSNDSWRNGAENHQSSEGAWETRLGEAVRAYFEWMPIREPANGDRVNGLARSFDIGSLAKIIMLDSRITGRDEPPSFTAFINQYATATPQGFPQDRNPAGQPKNFLGAAQEAYVSAQIADSRARGQTWQVFGQQTLFQLQPLPDFQNTTILNAQQKALIQATADQQFGAGTGAQLFQAGAAGLPNVLSLQDSWAGYPTARTRFYAQLAQCPNPIVLAGDSHNAWASNLRVPAGTSVAPVGVEFGTASVSSPGYEQSIPPQLVPTAQLDALLLEAGRRVTPFGVDRLEYVDSSRRGYAVVELTPTRALTQWIFVSTVFSTTYTATLGAQAQVLPGTKSLTMI